MEFGTWCYSMFTRTPSIEAKTNRTKNIELATILNRILII